jgi:AcrR family transcriptional regulator
MLYMSSAEEDRTARAIIRDEALRLFAAHGPDAVTVRQIAAAAGVSPALVVHHFGSKEGLREAVDQHLRRLLLADGAAGRQLFRRLYQMSTALMGSLVRAGLADPGADPAVRVGFLLANDLAVLLLREHLADVLGVDPLSGDGMVRWAREVLTIYAAGLPAAPAGGGP